MKNTDIPEDEQWKDGLLKELFLTSAGVLTVENLKSR
jgi:hypothetical protein